MSNRPKPTELRKVGGNAGHRPLNEAEPKPAPGEPDMPDGLTEEMQAVWVYWVGILLPMGVLTKADGLALEGLVRSVVRMRQAEAETEKYGMQVEEAIFRKVKTVDETTGKVQYVEEDTGRFRLKRNPATAIFKEENLVMKAYLSEFGLTPAARSKVKTNSGETENPLDAWLRKKSESGKPTDS